MTAAQDGPERMQCEAPSSYEHKGGCCPQKQVDSRGVCVLVEQLGGHG